jgi:hypothetical protein
MTDGGCLLGCCVVYSDRSVPTFQRCVLLAMIALMMEAGNTSETSVFFYQTTRRNNPGDSHLHTRRRENLKSQQDDWHFICRATVDPVVPYLRICKPHFFWQEFTLQNWGAAYTRNIMSFFTTEPATLILYVVKLPVETTSVWDCYLASYCTHANVPTYYRCIGIFWLHEISRHHRFPEVERPWRHWQITVNAAGDNQNTTSAIGNLVLSHR